MKKLMMVMAVMALTTLASVAGRPQPEIKTCTVSIVGDQMTVVIDLSDEGFTKGYKSYSMNAEWGIHNGGYSSSTTTFVMTRHWIDDIANGDPVTIRLYCLNKNSRVMGSVQTTVAASVAPTD